MKKILLFLAILLGSTSAVSAQKTFHNTIFETVPYFLSYNHIPYILDIEYTCDSKNYDDRVTSINIYDINLAFVKTFSTQDDIDCLELHDYIDKNGFKHGCESEDYYLTQTFFNDDADWEYIVHKDDTYTIKKTDGTVVGSFTDENWYGDIYVINDVVYTTREIYDEKTDEYTIYFYTVQEFRNFIGGANGMKPVPAMTKNFSKEAHDLMGRKALENHKGIVIKAGKKMIKK